MNWKKGLISLAITLIFTLFIGYGIEVFHDSPNNEDFCPRVYDLNDEEECLAAGGDWRDNNVEVPASEVKPVTRGFCNNKAECYQSYDNARVKHDQIVFIVSIIIGLLAIVAGIILKLDTIGTGILGGGILLIIYGTIRYWQHANDLLKFILLGIVLAVLIWVAYKKIEKR